MKSLLGLILTALTLCTFPTSAKASCEGAGSSDVLSTWYNPKLNSFLVEVGYPPTKTEDFREYFIQEKNIREAVASTEKIIWPKSPPDGSTMDLHRGKGDVKLRLSNETYPENSSLSSAIIFRSILATEKMEKKEIFNPKDTNAAYQTLLTSLYKLIESEAGYQKISQLKSCPYILKPQHPIAKTLIYRLFFAPTYAAVLKTSNEHDTDLGLLPNPFPGDDRSETTVDPQGKCWGLSDQKPLLIGFHWNWECQGTGDLTFTADQWDIKKP